MWTRQAASASSPPRPWLGMAATTPPQPGPRSCWQLPRLRIALKWLAIMILRCCRGRTDARVCFDLWAAHRRSMAGLMCAFAGAAPRCLHPRSSAACCLGESSSSRSLCTVIGCRHTSFKWCERSWNTVGQYPNREQATSCHEAAEGPCMSSSAGPNTMQNQKPQSQSTVVTSCMVLTESLKHVKTLTDLANSRQALALCCCQALQNFDALYHVFWVLLKLQGHCLTL